MSNDIKPGDLVMVVRGMPCCGFFGARKIGHVFVVSRVKGTEAHHFCQGCKTYLSRGTLYAEDGGDSGGMLSMLKKLDPPSEGDSLPTRADIDIEETA